MCLSAKTGRGASAAPAAGAAPSQLVGVAHAANKEVPGGELSKPPACRRLAFRPPRPAIVRVHLHQPAAPARLRPALAACACLLLSSPAYMHDPRLLHLFRCVSPSSWRAGAAEPAHVDVCAFLTDGGERCPCVEYSEFSVDGEVFTCMCDHQICFHSVAGERQTPVRACTAVKCRCQAYTAGPNDAKGRPTCLCKHVIVFHDKLSV